MPVGSKTSLREERYQKYPTNQESWVPEGDSAELMSLLYEHWWDAYQLRTRPWHHLGDISVEQFWQRSRDLYNGYVEPSDSVEDEWKSKAFKKKTRHKVIATVASFISSGIGVDFSALDQQNNLDRDIARVADDTYEWSLDREDFDFKWIRTILSMVVEGTACLFEEIAYDERKVKDIIDIDFETGKIKWEEAEKVDYKGPRSELIRIEEMYLGEAFEPDIQRQPYIFRRKVTTWERAGEFLGKYKNWKYVRPGNDNFFQTDGQNIERRERESDDTDENNVEILWYWNKSKELYSIVANGVLLTDPDEPFPYPHKQYPFAWDIHEPFADVNFSWGNSLPMVNEDDQVIVNSLWRLFIDSAKLRNKPPLFTSNFELAGTDLVVPGTVATKEPDDEIEIIPGLVQGLTPGEFNVMQMAERQMDENSIDPLLSGQTPQGDPTATEVNAVVGSAERLRGFSEQFVGSLLVQHAHLRLKNVFWFLTHDPEYKRIVKDRVKTRANQTGYRQINFVSAIEIPNPVDIMQEEIDLEEKEEPTTILYVDKDRVEDYRYHITVSATPKPRRNSTSKLLRAIQKYQFYAQNPLIDQMENTKTMVEAMGDDPQQMMKQPEMPEMAPPGQPAELPPGGPPGPGGAPGAPATVGVPPGAAQMAGNIASAEERAV